jgi:hypothetical protein
MVNPKHQPFTTTLDFIKENYGNYNLTFQGLQHNKLTFIYQDSIGYIKAEIAPDSTIYLTPTINFNTPNINWLSIEVYINADDNITASWVVSNYKWS